MVDCPAAQPATTNRETEQQMNIKANTTKSKSCNSSIPRTVPLSDFHDLLSEFHDLRCNGVNHQKRIQEQEEPI